MAFFWLALILACSYAAHRKGYDAGWRDGKPLWPDPVDPHGLLHRCPLCNGCGAIDKDRL